MSKLDVKKFYELAEKDLELAKKLAALDQETNLEASDLVNLNAIVNEKIVPLAKEQGLNFTADELVDYANERYTHLSEEDLLEVSGGVSPKVAGLGLATVLTLSLGGAAAMNLIHSDDGMPVNSSSAPETSVSTDADNLNDEDLPENFAKLLGKTGGKSGTNEEDMPSDAEMEEFQSFLKQLSAARSKAGDKSRAATGAHSASQDDVDMDELNKLFGGWEKFVQETEAAQKKKAASQILNAPTLATSTFNTEDVLESFGVKPKGAPSVSAVPAASVEPTAAKRDEVVLIDEARTDEDFINSEETTNVGKWDEIAKYIVDEYSVRARGSFLTDDEMATFSDELGAKYGKEDGVTYNAESKHLQIAVNKSEEAITMHVLQLLQHENEQMKINMLLSKVQEELLGVTDGTAKSEFQQEYNECEKKINNVVSDVNSLGLDTLKDLRSQIESLLNKVIKAKNTKSVNNLKLDDQPLASGDGEITTADNLQEKADNLADQAYDDIGHKIRSKLDTDNIDNEQAYAKELAQDYLEEHKDVTATYDEKTGKLTFSVTGTTKGTLWGTNTTTKSATVDVLDLVKLENRINNLNETLKSVGDTINQIEDNGQRKVLNTSHKSLVDELKGYNEFKQFAGGKKKLDDLTKVVNDVLKRQDLQKELRSAINMLEYKKDFETRVNTVNNAATTEKKVKADTVKLTQLKKDIEAQQKLETEKKAVDKAIEMLTDKKKFKDRATAIVSNPKATTEQAINGALDSLKKLSAEVDQQKQEEAGKIIDTIINEWKRVVATNYNDIVNGSLEDIKTLAQNFMDGKKRALENDAIVKSGGIVFKDDNIIQNAYKGYQFNPVKSISDIIDSLKVEFAGDGFKWDGTVENLFNCLKAADYNRNRITNIDKFNASLKNAVKNMSLGTDGALQINGWSKCGTGKEDIKHKIMLKAIALCAQDGNKLQEFNTSIKVKKNASIEDCKFDANDLAKLKSEIK